MHADLAQKVAADPLYQVAAQASGGWSLMVEARRTNLFLILTGIARKKPSFGLATSTAISIPA